MGKHSGEFKLRIDFFSVFFSFFFFFSAKMNLTVFAVILLAITRASLGYKTMQDACKADERDPDFSKFRDLESLGLGMAMRESARPASLVEKIMRAAEGADEPDEAKRANGANGAEKKEIKANMADGDIEDEAESGEVDDAKSNKVDLRQRDPSKEYCNRCEPFNICVDFCIEEERRDADTCKEACRKIMRYKYGLIWLRRYRKLNCSTDIRCPGNVFGYGYLRMEIGKIQKLFQNSLAICLPFVG